MVMYAPSTEYQFDLLIDNVACCTYILTAYSMLKLEDIYDVVIAKDGQEAYDLVKESKEKDQLFDLIFMDVQVG